MNNQSSFFSQQLSKLLSAVGKSQKDLSIQTNISESKLSKLLSGRIEPKYKDILSISDALKISPSFLFNTNNDSPPAEIGYILGSRVYTIIYRNSKQKTLILMGRTLESSTWIPNEALRFLSDMENRTIFSITLVSGGISVSDKNLPIGIPLMLYPDSKINFSVGSSYILQIIGEISKFSDLMKNHLSPEKIINF